MHQEAQGAQQQGTSIMTNIEDVIGILKKNSTGEIVSDNKNVELINESREMFYCMLKNKLVLNKITTN